MKDEAARRTTSPWTENSIINYDRSRLVRTLRYTLVLVPESVQFLAASKLGGAVFGFFCIYRSLTTSLHQFHTGQQCDEHKFVKARLRPLNVSHRDRGVIHLHQQCQRFLRGSKTSLAGIFVAFSTTTC